MFSLKKCSPNRALFKCMPIYKVCSSPGGTGTDIRFMPEAFSDFTVNTIFHQNAIERRGHSRTRPRCSLGALPPGCGRKGLLPTRCCRVSLDSSQNTINQITPRRPPRPARCEPAGNASPSRTGVSLPAQHVSHIHTQLAPAIYGSRTPRARRCVEVFNVQALGSTVLRGDGKLDACPARAPRPNLP